MVFIIYLWAYILLTYGSLHEGKYIFLKKEIQNNRPKFYHKFQNEAVKHLNSREIWLELVFKDIDEGLRKTAISSFVVKFGFDKKFIKMIPFNTEANRRFFWEGYIHIQKTMEKGLQQEIKRYIEGLDESSKMRAKEILDQFEEFYKLE